MTVIDLKKKKSMHIFCENSSWQYEDKQLLFVIFQRWALILELHSARLSSDMRLSALLLSKSLKKLQLSQETWVKKILKSMKII